MVDKNEFFQQVVIKICSTLDLGKGLKRSLEYIKDYIPLDAINIAVAHPDINKVEVFRISEQNENDGPGARILLSPFELDWSLKEAERPDLRQVLLLNDPRQEPAVREATKRRGTSDDFSLLLIKLGDDGQEIGAVGFRTKGRHRYTREHAELVAMLRGPFTIALSNALKHREISTLKNMLSANYRDLHDEMRDQTTTEIIGADFGLREVMGLVRKVAQSDSPALLLGETGVGKDVIANAIHYLSDRRQSPFIRVNCGAIPDTLIDSELFGHEKGAFTGAEENRRGRIERAHQGTLFLDEIGELPPQAQVRLLHVLQNEEIERVGGSATIPVDIRFIFATHRDLKAMVKAGTFRQDLYYRLNLFPIHIPPLRERMEDLPALIHYLINKKRTKLRLKERPELAPDSIKTLLDYDWPGNIRELENVIERALIRHQGGRLELALSVAEETAPSSAKTRAQKADPGRTVTPLEVVTREHIQFALKQAGGKIAGTGGAADLLQVHPNTLRKKMDKLGIQYKKKNTGKKSHS